jgi:hypothetical protein
MPSIARDATREITTISWEIARRTGRAPSRAASRLARVVRGRAGVWADESRYA